MAHVDTHDAFNAIPSIAWDVISSELKEQRKKPNNHGKILIRKFRYVIAEKKWTIGGSTGNVELKNLFFEFLSSSPPSCKQAYSNNKIAEDFIAIQFDDKLGNPGSGNDGISRISSFQSDQIREKFLRSGLRQPDSKNVYYVVGCSNSQIKDFSFLFRRSKSLKANVNYLKDILPNIEKLEEKKGVAKRVKYTGLLFSGVKNFITLPKDVDIRKGKSVEHNNYDFTDGPGIISIKLAKFISEQMNLREVPSVFQVRYGGKVNDGRETKLRLCKGVLLVDPTETNRHVLTFRESMLKMEINQYSNWQKCMGMKLGIVDFSKKTIGKISRQTLTLLTASVPDESLLEIQRDHIQVIENCWDDPFWLAYVAAMYNNTDKNRILWKTYSVLIQNILRMHEMAKDSLTQYVPKSYRDLCSLRKKLYNNDRKLQIPLGCSRFLFGAVFPEILHDFLREGQCLVFTDNGPLIGNVIVSRSPSYSAGDVRVLESVDLPDKFESLRQLRNCILFATQGDRPEADKMGGGDMDGDLYLVIWDERLLKFSQQIGSHKAADYDATPKSRHLDDDDEKNNDWISYMARFDNSMLGKIDAAFYKVVQEKGLLSEEAKKLNSIFSGLVDKNPESLNEFEKIDGAIYLTHSGYTLWDEMVEVQNQCIGKMNRYIPSSKNIKHFVENCNSPYFAQDMRSHTWYMHFETNIGKSEIDTFLQFLQTRFPANFASIENVPVKEDQHSSKNENLNKMFEEEIKLWNNKRFEVFNTSLKDINEKRERISKECEIEQRKKNMKLDEFQTKRADCEGMLKRVVIMHNNRPSNKHIQQQVEQLKNIIQNISQQEDDFLSGKTRRDMEFELNTGELKVIQLKKEVGDIDCCIEEFIQVIANTHKKISIQSNRFKESKAVLQERMNTINLVKVFYETFLNQREHFDSNMISESSYRTIRKMLKDLESFNMLGQHRLSTLLNIFLDEENNTRNEDVKQLRSFFMAISRLDNYLKLLGTQNFFRRSEEKIKRKIGELDAILKAVEDKYASELVEKQNLQRKLNFITWQKRQRNSPFPTTSELSAQQAKLTEDIDPENIRDMLKAKQISINSHLQSSRDIKTEKINLKDKIKRFKSSHQTLASKVYEAMSGELLGTIPTSIFLQFQKALDASEGASSEKRKVALIYSKIMNTSISDPDLFKMFKKTIQEIEASCSKDKDKEKKNVLIIASEISTMYRILQEKSNELEDLKVRKDNISAQIEELSEKNTALKKKIEAMYWPEHLNELETELNDVSNFEDCINAGIDHVNLIINESCIKWTNILNDDKRGKVNLKKSLQRLSKSISRICDIEKNRLLGMPKNDERYPRLPVYSQRAKLKQCLSENDFAIVIAGTGCGKSTQIPQYLADDLLALKLSKTLQTNEKHNFVRVCCSQPRRLAAQRIAERVSSEYISDIGDLVGYRVGRRGSSIEESQKVSRNTRIEFVTEGWLIYSLMKSQNLLQNYDCIIVDEAHERNLETDLLLCLLKRYSIQNENKKIKVVVMSATIDPKLFSDYFNGCPVIDCPGKQYPVDEFFRPISGGEVCDEDPIVSKAVDVIFEISNNYGLDHNFEAGDCLIFLSGARQITNCVQKINSMSKNKKKPYIVAYPLYAQMPENEKDAATNPEHRTGLNKETDGKHKLSRKIICCTNIAETSLTIGNIRFVIESGFAKKIGYDVITKSKTLKEEAISIASANQRRGRAGRVEPGRCYYLYSKEFKAKMPEYEEPKILATPVERLIIRSLVMSGESIEDLGLLECPGSGEIELAKRRLSDLKFIRTRWNGSIYLTKDGRLANGLSMLDPESVRMIINSQKKEFNCFDQAIKLGAIMSYDEDFFFDNDNTEGIFDSSSEYHYLGDHFQILSYLNDFEKMAPSTSKKRQKQWCEQRSMMYTAMRRMQLVIKESYNFLKKNNASSIEMVEASSDQVPNDNESLLGVLISGYFSHLCKCIEPKFPLKMGFMSIEADFHVIVGNKNVCLNRLFDKEEDIEEIDYIPDSDTENSENDDEDSMCDSESDRTDISNNTITNDKNEIQTQSNAQSITTCSFILYGSLFVKYKLMKKLIFAEDLTLINDGAYLQRYAPEEWIKRVWFDPTKQSICKRTIFKLGRNFLFDTKNKLKEIENELEEKGIMYHFQWGKNSISFYGREEDVQNIVEKISNDINEQKEKMIKEDNFNDRLNRTFKCGLKYISKNSRQSNGSKFHEGHGQNFEQSLWRMNDKVYNKRSVEIYCNGSNPNIFSQGLAALFPSATPLVKWKRIQLNFDEEKTKNIKTKADQTLPVAIFRDNISKGFTQTMYLLFFLFKRRQRRKKRNQNEASASLKCISTEFLRQFYDVATADKKNFTKPISGKSGIAVDIVEKNMPEYDKIVVTFISFLSKKERKETRGIIIDFITTMVVREIDSLREKIAFRIQTQTKEVNRRKLIDTFLRMEEKNVFSPAFVDITNGGNDMNTDIKDKWLTLWSRVGDEWNQRHDFWNKFCSDVRDENNSKIFDVSVKYSPARARFEIFCANPTIRENVKRSILRKLIKMCQKSCCIRSISDEVIPRWKIWSMVSIIEEFKSECRDVLFRISLETTLSSDSHVSENESVSDFNKNGFFLPEIDFEKINSVISDGGKFYGLSVDVYGYSKSLDHVCISIKSALSQVEKDSTTTAVVGILEDDPNKKQIKKRKRICCMCRRNILEDKNTSKGKSMSKSKTFLRANRLTLCGCLFCRTCFLNASAICLKGDLPIKCLRCDSPVLAKDIVRIIRPFTNETDVKNQNNKDWDFLANLSEIQSLKEVAGVYDKKCLVCPDCCTPMIVNEKFKLVSCHGKNCHGQFCTRCGYDTQSALYTIDCKMKKCNIQRRMNIDK